MPTPTAPASPPEAEGAPCICQGNWRAIVREAEPLLDRKFRDSRGKVWTFFGIVYGKDDYYYGMYASGETQLLSCVGSIEGFGFSLIEEAAAKEGEADCAQMTVNPGIVCVHCNGSGLETQHYDEQEGWSDPNTPCRTCKGSKRIRTVEEYLATLPADWHQDSSLKTWFPLHAEEYERLQAQNEALKRSPGCPLEHRRATLAQKWGW